MRAALLLATAAALAPTQRTRRRTAPLQSSVVDAANPRSVGLALELDDGTRKVHSVAENTQFVTGFFRGLGSSDRGAVDVVYEAMERQMDETTSPTLKALDYPALRRLPGLERDMEFYYGADWRTAKPRPSAATLAYVKQIEAAFITEWYETLNGLDLDDAQRAAIVDEANVVFRLNIAIFDELEGNPLAAFVGRPTPGRRSAGILADADLRRRDAEREVPPPVAAHDEARRRGADDAVPGSGAEHAGGAPPQATTQSQPSHAAADDASFARSRRRARARRPRATARSSHNSATSSSTRSVGRGPADSGQACTLFRYQATSPQLSTYLSLTRSRPASDPWPPRSGPRIAEHRRAGGGSGAGRRRAPTRPRAARVPRRQREGQRAHDARRPEQRRRTDGVELIHVCRSLRRVDDACYAQLRRVRAD
ncbi:hypothetical protein JL720_15251 [Aureococcus anophagefferens]|nr:hypothetical protein JL720_15251 [Aureococcus anophagefferens]